MSSNETILRDALTGALEFLTALLNNKADGAVDLLSSDGEYVEAMINEALARTEFEPCIDVDQIADLASELVEWWDIGTCMEAAEQALIDFWSGPEGADDLAAHLANREDC